MSKLFAKIEKATTPGKMAAKEQHNLRIKPCDKADKNREHLNEYTGTGEIVKFIKAKEKTFNKALKDAGKRKIRKDANKVFEVVIAPSSNEFFELNDEKDFWNNCDSFFEKFIGEGCIAQKSIHRDEHTNHAHYMLMPLFEEGLNYNKYFPDAQACEDFQEALYSYMTIEKGYDFEERDKAKDSRREHVRVTDWYKKVNRAMDTVEALNEDNIADYAVKGVLADVDVERANKRVIEANKRVNKLEEDNMELSIENMELSDKYNHLYQGVLDVVKDKKSVAQIERDGKRHFIEKEKERIKEVAIDDDLEL